jgi:uncharacterized protein (TIGR04255 family)
MPRVWRLLYCAKSADRRAGLTSALPIRLANDPIVEAVFEIRFEGAPSASDLLPGLLFPRFRDRFPKQERLPIADIPRQFADADPDLHYLPRLRFGGERMAILISGRSAAVACSRPYVGWGGFSAMILEVVAALHETGLMNKIERTSLKYVNVLNAKTFPGNFKNLRFSAQLGNHDLGVLNTNLRTEIPDDGVISIVELQGNVLVKTQNGDSFSGIMVSVDSISSRMDQFAVNGEGELNLIHDTEKRIFFDILTPEVLSKLGPTWE